jgi:hypothetical protein
MPVEKFRSVSEMPRPGLVPVGERWTAMERLWRRARWLSPPAAWPRGTVERYRSVEEAERARLPRARPPQQSGDAAEG